MTRQPNWDIDRPRGEEAEALVRRLRSALALGEVEVKCDDGASRTGNVFLEYECQTRAGWMPSGIATTRAVNWVWVLYDMRVIVWMPVWLLKNMGRAAWADEHKRASCRNGSHPTRGVLIPVDTLLSEARLAVPMTNARAEWGLAA